MGGRRSAIDIGLLRNFGGWSGLQHALDTGLREETAAVNDMVGKKVGGLWPRPSAGNTDQDDCLLPYGADWLSHAKR
jgi:hypothetical protein